MSVSQGVFEGNQAHRGGAVGTDPFVKLKGTFHLLSSTFIGNSATLCGGAIAVSGFQSGAFVDGCLFQSNLVGRTTSKHGRLSWSSAESGGGGVCVQKGAALYARNTISRGNRVWGLMNGGFVAGKDASRILLQSINISGSQSGSSGKGGGVYVTGSNLTLDRVNIRDCKAGNLGGWDICRWIITCKDVWCEPPLE